MAALLRHAVRRIGVSALQRTQAAVTSPAVAEERRRLLTRRLTTAPASQRAPRTQREEYLEKKFGHLKPHQICWLFIKLFPAGKVFGLVALTGATVSVVSATSEFKLEKEAVKEAERQEAEKKREQSASAELKRQEAEKKREQSASAELKRQEAEKKQEQSASTELERLEAEKKREQSASTQLKQQKAKQQLAH